MRKPPTALVVLFLIPVLVLSAEPFRAGLQPGDRIPGAFHPLNINGPNAGKEHCLVCENGLNPVVMIFARELNAPLQKLLDQVDAQTAKLKDHEVGCFVVFMNETEEFKTRLEKLAKDRAFKHMVLSVFSVDGLDGFNIVPEGDIIVVLYREHKVRVNHAFKKGEFNEKAVATIVADIPKILSK